MDEQNAEQRTPTNLDDELVKTRSNLKKALEDGIYGTLLDLISEPLDRIYERHQSRVKSQTLSSGSSDVELNPIGNEQSTDSSKKLPFWLSVLILDLLILALGFGISAVLQEVHGMKIQILEVGNVVISFFFIILVKSYLDQFKKGFSSDLIEYVNSVKSLGKLKDWFESTTKRWPPIAWGTVFSFVLTAILVFYIPSLVYDTTVSFLGWGPLILFFLANVTIGTGGYYLWISRNFRVEVKSFDFIIYEPNPSKSHAIVKLSKLLSIPVTIGAYLSALTTLIFSIAGVLSWVVLLIVIISGWYPMVSLFVRNHIALASIITTAKDKTLSELQARILELQRESLRSKTGIEYLQKLIEYHDSIVSTPNSALNFHIYLGLFNSLLLPLATFVLSNWQNVMNFLGR